MTLEATFICIDNSEATRNGDYHPTRLQAVTDACNVLCGAKTQMNPENGVGFLTMGDDRITIVETLTADLGRLLSSLTNIRPGGKLNFLHGLQVAQLGLKNRMNKSQRQRIVAFVGSEIDASEKELVQLAKRLKKHSVAVDIVAFGCEKNVALLEKFISNVNSKQNDRDTSHLVVVNEGSSIADTIVSSPIVNPDGSSGEAAMFGINNADMDPQLAMVLRMSMEEERARQEKAKQEASGAAGAAGGSSSSGAAGSSGESGAAMPVDRELTDEEQLQLAMRMSLQEHEEAQQKESQAAGSGESSAAPAKMEVDGDRELTEEEQMELALKLSMQEQTDPELDAMLNDPSLAQELASAVGVDAKKVVDDKKEEKKDDDKK